MFPDTRSRQTPETSPHRQVAPSPSAFPPADVLPARPPARIARRVLFWRRREHDELTVRVMIAPRSRIDVDLWWNRRGGSADVQLVFGLYDEAVEFGSLTGNGFEAPRFHRAGFGTLAVNIGIRALQSACEPSMGVHGVLSHTAELCLPPEQRSPLEAARRAFWRRFGLTVLSDGAPPLDYLRGTVGALRKVADGQIAGQFARDLDLQDFSELPPFSPSAASRRGPG